MWKRRIVRELDELAEICGNPTALRMHNGTELISVELEKWARRLAIERRFIQPARPMQNGLIERFKRTYREEALNCYAFETLGEVRRMTADCITRYNEIRTRESLGDLTPRQYLMAKSLLPSTSKWSEKRGGDTPYRTFRMIFAAQNQASVGVERLSLQWLWYRARRQCPSLSDLPAHLVQDSALLAPPPHLHPKLAASYGWWSGLPIVEAETE